MLIFRGTSEPKICAGRFASLKFEEGIKSPRMHITLAIKILHCALERYLFKSSECASFAQGEVLLQHIAIL